MAGAGPEFSMREAGPLEVAVTGALCMPNTSQ